MTNDIKDLLALAAKACGYEVQRVVEARNGIDILHVVVRSKETFGLDAYWAPHLDDGDGARMEEKLDLHLSWLSAGVSSGPKMTYERFSDHNNDRQAARRWASLRAAAQIGKGMK